MSVASVPSTGTSQTAATAAATKSATGVAASMNADTFLTLLMTQLKNQDPTKPMDSTAYVSELATFSQVEQATKTNTKLDSLLSSSFLSQADQIIGRTITSSDGTVTGEVQSVKITSEGALARLTNGQDVLLSQGISLSR
ncbi:flagellar hook assembly protein FlgD [Methylobacterium sp. V23]|jgi:flagellar basal-body rod modification protein FlgD|uniref:flagellar hook assembly protein FlgD n=1 Tax=Methylobacterium sp. V23 TaxID=2044878 RepID=UPI000CDA863D|nr:flagellar hook assembly protein FlgD [Methylobacterium sp. V23]POR41523.1 flagellar basal body rod modification protein [Methylobacterium sp. V23]